MDLVAMFHNVFGAPEAKSPECDAAIDDMKASCAPTDWKTFDWSKCAEASKALADKCAKEAPPAEEAEALGAKPSGNPDCDAAIAEMHDACAASDDETAVYDWKKCAKASKAIGAACAKPGPKPDEPFNFLACVAQAKMTESECAYDVKENLAKEDKFDAYIDAFEQCEPSVDLLVQACQ